MEREKTIDHGTLQSHASVLVAYFGRPRNHHFGKQLTVLLLSFYKFECIYWPISVRTQKLGGKGAHVYLRLFWHSSVALTNEKVDRNEHLSYRAPFPSIGCLWECVLSVTSIRPFGLLFYLSLLIPMFIASLQTS